MQDREYFDAARFPDMRFVSERVRSSGGGQLEVQGQLTIRGKTRPITVSASYDGAHTVSDEGVFAMFRTEFTIDRYDYDVVGGSLLGPAISRQVHIKIIAAGRSEIR
ncbi:MAG: YceI family protein [Vicinamibacterales bacterium]